MAPGQRAKRGKSILLADLFQRHDTCILPAATGEHLQEKTMHAQARESTTSEIFRH